MPASLQESSTFTILGDCGRHFLGELEEYCCTKQLPLDAQFVRKEHFGTSRNSIIIGSVGNGDQHPSYDHRRWRCDCCVLDGFLDACRKSAVKEGSWVQLFCKSGMSFKSNLNQTVLCHFYFDGQQIEINHCHVCKSKRCLWYPCISIFSVNHHVFTPLQLLSHLFWQINETFCSICV